MQTKHIILKEIYSLEVTLVACVLLDNTLDITHIGLNYNSLVRITSLLKLGNHNYPLTFTGLKANNESEYKAVQDIDEHCETIIKKYGDANMEIVNKIFYSTIKQLKYANYNLTVTNIIEECLSSIETGATQEAVVKLKTIPHLQQKEVQESSIDLAMTLLDSDDNFRSGIEEIDNMAGLRKRNLMAVAADTGSQKTTWTVWFMIQTMLANPKFTAVFFSKEMDKKEIIMKIVTYFTSIETQKMMAINIILDPIEREKERADMYAKIKQNIADDENFKSVMDRFTVLSPNEFNNANDIALTIEVKRPDIWCLDFLTLLGEGNGSNTTIDGFMSEQMKILKEITVSNNSFGIIIAQLKHNTVDARTYKVPNRSDIEYGKQLKQQAYQILMLFSPSLYYTEDVVNPRYFYAITQKSRYGTNFTLPFYAFPSKNNYAIPDFDKGELLGWLKEYEKETRPKK